MKKYIITEESIKEFLEDVTASCYCADPVYEDCTLGETQDACYQCILRFFIKSAAQPYTKECSCYSEAARRQVLLENITEDV